MNNEKINELKSLDKYFQKGDKRRGEAMILAVEAFLLGKGDKIKRQTIIITTGQLHRLIEGLEEEHTKWEDGSGFFDEEKEFQINIINKNGLSDTWAIESQQKKDKW